MRTQTRRLLLVPAAAIAVVVGTTSASGQKPKPPPYGQTPNVTIAASPNPVVFPRPVVVSGRVRGARAGVTVSLLARPVGAARYTVVSTTKTTSNGRYSTGHRPTKNLLYRVVAQTLPAVQSADLRVGVRPLVGLRISDATVRRGARVRFFGIVRPSHNGRRVAIQRRGRSGRFFTVARKTLRRIDAHTSRYSRRVRVRRTGEYRVILPGHFDHVTGISRTRTIVVG